MVSVVNDLERSLEQVHLQDCDSEKEEIRQPVAVAQSTPVPVDSPAVPEDDQVVDVFAALCDRTCKLIFAQQLENFELS